MDPIFEAEQQHLSDTYAKLDSIEREVLDSIQERLARIQGEKRDMLDDLGIDLGNGVNVETYVELEELNALIDSHNLGYDLDMERLNKARLLKQQPYFAKVSLRFAPDQEPRDIYLGSTGIVDERHHHFIIDWRSPVAETYYNQQNGPMTYEANGRTISCELLLRRQFDIDADTLNAYFDTTVAIEDPLLLASLSRNRSAKLQDITATIQKEQNQVVRHEDVPALLVKGIAGSGKTSVLLQRIAYLFYRERDNLNPHDVYLITPNPVFQHYIDEVLPNMGERNPRTITWNDLMKRLKLDNRALGRDVDSATLKAIDDALPELILDARDFQDLRVDDERVITAAQARRAYESFRRIPAGPHRAALTADELHERIEQRIARLCRDENVWDDIAELPYEEHIRLFGRFMQPVNDEDWKDAARTYLTDRYAPIEEAIEDGAWLRIDRIGMRMLGKRDLSAIEWLYLKLALASGNNRAARYVMVDEVQDYTQAQLMVLARYFNNAHFLLLGDENQAITEGTASFPIVEETFRQARGSVSVCELMTSYRSSPEITALFTSLMPKDERVKTSSVQRPGTKPTILRADDKDEYLECVSQAVAEASEEGKLTAVIASDRARAKWLAKQLGDTLVLMDGRTELPDSGAIVLDLKMAKGLEFDAVVIPDAQGEVYDESRLSRNRLYTAISRATQKVTLVSQGELTPLLAEQR